jgi:phage antirepressor YoqD-like protein
MDKLATIKQTMTSREIAELIGKPHSDLLKAIRNMEEAWIQVGQGRFSLMFDISKLPNGGGRRDPYYELTKTECLYIATKFNDVARAKVIIRWEELENLHRVPRSFSEALMLAAKQAEIIEEKDRQLTEQKPKVLFADAVETSKNSILIGEMSKILKQNGIEIGQNRLFVWLRAHGYLICRPGAEFNVPTQRSMELGLFEIKKTVINQPDGSVLVGRTAKVTGKGQTYFVNKFLNDRTLTAV